SPEHTKLCSHVARRLQSLHRAGSVASNHHQLHELPSSSRLAAGRIAEKARRGPHLLLPAGHSTQSECVGKVSVGCVHLQRLGHSRRDVGRERPCRLSEGLKKEITYVGWANPRALRPAGCPPFVCPARARALRALSPPYGIF